MGKVDYAQIELPEDRDYPDYSYAERRASIYQLIVQRGSPTRLPKQEDLAEQFDVSQQQISKDMNALKEYISDNCAPELRVRTTVAFEKAYKDAIQKANTGDMEWKQVVEILKEWWDWLYERGEKQDMSGPDTQVNVAQKVVSLEDKEKKLRQIVEERQ